MPQQTRVMKNVLGTSTTLTDDFLDSMREVVDPPADLVAVDMCQGDDYKVFADLVKNHQVWEDDGSPSRKLPEDSRGASDWRVARRRATGGSWRG
jgi:hypothetical protein